MQDYIKNLTTVKPRRNGASNINYPTTIKPRHNAAGSMKTIVEFHRESVEIQQIFTSE